MKKIIWTLFLFFSGLIACASYDQYITFSEKVIEKPEEQLLIVLNDTSKITQGYYKRYLENPDSRHLLTSNLINEHFKPDSTDLYDVDTYKYPTGNNKILDMLEVKFISKNKNLIIFQFEFDELSKKYKLHMIYFDNLDPYNYNNYMEADI